jgi:hypothetical protein
MQEYYSICTNSKIYSVVVFMAIPMYLYFKFVYANGASAKSFGAGQLLEQ